MDRNLKLFQIIDANLNRAREGLRVCEDIARFIMGDKPIAMVLKAMRHSATNASLSSKKMQLKKLVQARDTRKDALKHVDFLKDSKAGYAGILMSNIQRVKESLRVLEECCKIVDEKVSQRYRKLRFRVYDLEKEIGAKL